MSMTMQQEKEKHLNREIKKMRQRQNELKFKIVKKKEEGTQIAGAAFFSECFNFFCRKA